MRTAHTALKIRAPKYGIHYTRLYTLRSLVPKAHGHTSRTPARTAQNTPPAKPPTQLQHTVIPRPEIQNTARLYGLRSLPATHTPEIRNPEHRAHRTHLCEPHYRKSGPALFTPRGLRSYDFPHDTCAGPHPRIRPTQLNISGITQKNNIQHIPQPGVRSRRPH